MHKKVEELCPTDFGNFPVWEFILEDEMAGDTFLRPVTQTPVATLANRLVGTKVRLANGYAVDAVLGNLDNQNFRRTQHFLTLTVFRGSQRFDLARYHDADYAANGPLSLSAFLGSAPEDIFPIAYDVRSLCLGNSRCLSGLIENQPSEVLSRTELIALAVV